MVTGEVCQNGKMKLTSMSVARTSQHTETSPRIHRGLMDKYIMC